MNTFIRKAIFHIREAQETVGTEQDYHLGEALYWLNSAKSELEEKTDNVGNY